MNQSTIPAAVLNLTHRELVELFRRLNGGTAGFDTGRYKKAELLTVAAAWLAQGVPAALMQQHADAIAAERAAASVAIPAAPAALAMPVPAAIVAAPQPDAALAASIDAIVADRMAAPQPDVRASILAAIAAPAPQPAAQSANVAQPVLLAPSALTAEQAEIAAALASTAATHPAAVLPPMDDAPLATLANAPQGREFARTLFRDLPAAIVAQIPATLTVPVFSHPDAEKPSSGYKWTAALLIPCLIAMASPVAQRVWFGGPSATGKTEMARQLAARTGRALYRVNFNRFTEASEIVGDMGLVNGSTQFVYGPVALACKDMQGAVLLLDELTYCTPGSLSCLNPILERDGTPLRLPRTGEMLPVPADLFVIAADNTFGTGDSSGEYHARNELGVDTRTRFQFKLAFGYLNMTDERAILRDAILRDVGRKPSNESLAPLMKILEVSRTQAGTGELQGAPSLRAAVAFATLMAHGYPIDDAFNITIVNGAPAESHEKLRTIFAAHWPTAANGTLAAFGTF